MATANLALDRQTNPVDLLESIANRNDWGCERSAEDELVMVVTGSWADYHISLNWRDDLETLHLASAFDLRIPDTRLNEMYRLIAMVNEQLWIGHFDYWSNEGVIMFRHGLLLNGTLLTPQQCDALLQTALEACEKYYQAFQFCVWAGKPAAEALASTMFETEGQA